MIISRKIRCYSHALVMTCIIFSAVAHAQSNKEYQVKAAFLLNFIRFVDWPPASFSSEQAPIVIGVLGTNPFGKYLNEIITDEKIGGRSLIIQQYQSITDIKSCHILFINKAETEYLSQVPEVLKGKDILTVSDAPSFLKQGGMILFFTRSNKIQFQVNLDAVKKTKLDISSKLLRLAEIFVP